MYINLLIKIKNAVNAGKKTVKVFHTKMDKAVLDILERHKFVDSVEVKGRPPKRAILINLRLEKTIRGIKFLSKPSARRYIGYKEIKKIKGGYGLLVLSTPKGIMDGGEARKQKVGGEALFEIW